MAAAGCSHPQSRVHAHGHGGGRAHQPAAGQHGNPADLEGYIARQEAPERAAWQKPDEVVSRIALPPGAAACEIGAGPGYFSLRLGQAVGDTRVVYAVDVEPRMLAALLERLAKTGARNVVPVLGLPHDPLIPTGACDIVLLVNTLHHVSEPAAYLERLRRSLKPGGPIINIDFHKRQSPVGPPVEARIDRADFLALAAKAGLKVTAEHDLLPYQ